MREEWPSAGPSARGRKQPQPLPLAYAASDASTAGRAPPETLRIARGLLDGSIHPPEHVEHTKPTAYVEMGKASKKLGPDGKPLQPEYTAAKILAKQPSYGGIVGRLHNWFLYAKGAPHIDSIDEAAQV